MKINLSPTYISDSSSARRQPIPIDVNLDPTVNSLTAPFKQSRQNGYISPIGLNKNASAYLLFSQTNFLAIDPTDGNKDKNPTPTPDPGTPPLQVANLHAAWDLSAQNILVTFDFDLTDSNNQYFNYFDIKLHSISSNGYLQITPKVAYNSYTLSSSTINQSVKISLDDIYTTGIFSIGDFDGLEIATYDTANQTAGYVSTALSAPVCDLDPPIISSTSNISTYSISTSNLNTQKSKQSFSIEAIQEFITTTVNASKSDIDAEVAAAISAGKTGWVQVAEGSYSPITIYANDGLQRYVRAFFLSTNGLYSGYSNYVTATPQPLQPNNSLPPSGVTNAAATFGGSSGDDIIVSYTLPTINTSDPNALISLKVKLIPTAQSTQSGFFYHTVAANETNFTIPSNLIFAQFGNYYSSYSGTIVGVSQYGTESTSVANISTFTKIDTLSSVIPAVSISNVIDGYSVSFDFTATNANSGQVYQFFTNPNSWIGTNSNYAIPDYLDATFSSWSITNPNQIVVSSLSAENGNFNIPSNQILPYSGYLITGNNIPENTWITSISGTGPSYTLNLNNSLIQAPSDIMHLQSKVYDGIGPANVFLKYFSSIYVVVVFYNKYGARSKNSNILIGNPTDPSTSVISNAIQIGSGGSIYVGNSATTGSRIVLGPSGNKGPDGTSAYSGIFAFDYGSTTSSSASTAIITNPGASSYTFETTNAKIADWSINSTQIQNTLSGGSSNYVGLSATGNYAFWAGSETSGGDSLAKFTVTPQGAVVARNIQIIGSGNNSDTLLRAGSNFTVKGDGTIIAQNATINGHLNVDQSSTFNSDITLGINAYLVAGSLGGAGVIISKAGITANNSNNVPTTQITATPMGTTSDGNSITFSTNAAYLGSTSSSGNPWIVTNGKMYSGVISLDSANQNITVNTSLNGVTNPNSGVQIKWGSTDSAAIKVGDLTDSNGTPNASFYVTHGGALHATNATVSGNITANSFMIDSNNYWNDNNHTGDFKVGSTNSYMWYTGGQLTVKGSITSGSSITGASINGGTLTIGTQGTTNSYLDVSTSSITVQGASYTSQVSGQLGITTISAPSITMLNGKLTISNVDYMGDLNSSIGSFVRFIASNPSNGNLERGPAVYYNTIDPQSAGFVGDIWFTYA